MDAWVQLAGVACIDAMVLLIQIDDAYAPALVLLFLGAALMTYTCALASRVHG
jgi:hypothetical protein